MVVHLTLRNSPPEKTSCRGSLGQGPMVITPVACQMTEPKILDWFRQVGVQISAGQISNPKGQHQFHARTRCTKPG